MLVAFLSMILAPQYELRWVTPEYTLDLAKPSTLMIPLVCLNHTDQPLEIWAAGFWPNHKLTLLNAKGEHVPLTEIGKQGVALFESGARGKNFPILVPARGSYSYKTPPLPDFFELSPGQYSLTVVYSEKVCGKPLKLKTARLRLDVT